MSSDSESSDEFYDAEDGTTLQGVRYIYILINSYIHSLTLSDVLINFYFSRVT